MLPAFLWYFFILVIVAVLGKNVAVVGYRKNMAFVPYTRRSQFVLVPFMLEKILGELIFSQMKLAFQGHILPASDQKTVRVTRIFTKLLEAIPQSANRSLNWELVLLDDSSANFWSIFGGNNSYSILGGKIVFDTELFQKVCNTDSEIAAVLAHEIARCVARHGVELISRRLELLLARVMVVIFCFCQFIFWNMGAVMRFVVASTGLALYLLAEVYQLFFIPNYRGMMLEADYIRLQLMASAGYDPRIAPKFYKRFHHSTGKPVAELLPEPQVMEEVGARYKSVRAKKSQAYYK